MSSTMPVLILREGTSRTRGSDAQRSNIMAAKIVAEIVKIDDITIITDRGVMLTPALAVNGEIKISIIKLLAMWKYFLRRSSTKN